MSSSRHRFVAAALLGACIASAQAAAVPLAADGAWSAFNVNELDALSLGVEWISNDNTLSPEFGTPLFFDFTIAAGFTGTLTVVDAGFAGDAFVVTDHGVVLGSTSAVPLQDALARARRRHRLRRGAGRRAVQPRHLRARRRQPPHRRLAEPVGRVRRLAAQRHDRRRPPDGGADSRAAHLGAAARRPGRRRLHGAPPPRLNTPPSKVTPCASSPSPSPRPSPRWAARRCRRTPSRRRSRSRSSASTTTTATCSRPAPSASTPSVPAAQRPPVGGAEYLAAHVARLKAQNPLQRRRRRRRLHRRLAADLGAVLRRAGGRDAEQDRRSSSTPSATTSSTRARPSCAACRTAAARSTNGVPDPNSCKGVRLRRAGHLRRRELQVAVGQRDRDRAPAARCCRPTASRPSTA